MVRAVARLLLLSCSGCSTLGRGEPAPTELGPDGVRSEQQGIAGGVPSGERAVVSLETTASATLGLCSGVLIAPQLVLTAAHCVLGRQLAATCAELSPGEPLALDTLRVSTVEDLSAAAEDDWTFYGVSHALLLSAGASSLCGHDLALLALDETIEDVTPLPLADSAARAGDTVSLLGYGAGHPSGAGERRRRLRAEQRVLCVGDSCQGLEPSGWAGAPSQVTPEVARTEFVTTAGACPGDSGGPALRDGQILGILSRGYDDCTAPVYGFDAPGILTAVRQLAAAGHVDLPAWADNVPPAAPAAGGSGLGGAAGHPATGGTSPERAEGGAGAKSDESPPATTRAAGCLASSQRLERGRHLGLWGAGLLALALHLRRVRRTQAR